MAETISVIARVTHWGTRMSIAESTRAFAEVRNLAAAIQLQLILVYYSYGFMKNRLKWMQKDDYFVEQLLN